LSGFLHRIAPGELEQYHDIPGYGDKSPEGFADFVQFLAAGNLYFDRHFWPQTDLMYQAPDRFDHVMRLETLVCDMRVLLRHIGQDPDLAEKLQKPHRIEQNSKNKITRAQTRLNAFYCNRTRALARALYARDFNELPVVQTMPTYRQA
jgi:hypothetical protein